jgi:hypothetical protein
MNTCLGCGGQTYTNGDCPKCDDCAARLIASSHWPLEVSLSLAALVEVEEAIGIHVEDIETQKFFEERPSLLIELQNLRNNIRSHFQHVRAERRARKAAPPTPEKDPLLL